MTMKKHRVGLRFAGMMGISLLIGLGIGILVGVGGGWIAAGLDWLGWALALAAPALMAAAGVIGLGAAGWALRSGNRWAAAARLDETELDDAAQAAQEEAISRADRRYGIGMTAVSVALVLTLTLFGLWAQGAAAGLGTLAAVAILLAVSFAALAMQGALVRATKRLYPEKQGNVLDLKFQKEWFGSCDEAERQLIWQCGYQSMRVTSRAMLALFVLLVIFGNAAPIGPLPMLTLGALWLVQTLSYQLTALRLGGTRREKKAQNESAFDR